LDQELREYVRKVKSAATSEEKMHAELNLAQDIQLSSLPKGFIHDETLSLYANMNPAKEVGGDLYGFADLPGGKLYIFVGDVSGKGIPAALFMMQAKTILQETLSEKDLLAAVTNTNEHLLKEGSADLFLTAFIAVLDKNTGLLQYVNAGHEPIFVCHFGQYSKLKEEADVPLATLEGYEFHLQALQLDPGDRIFAYTDGVSESMSRNGVLYGKRKIEEVLNSLAGAEDKDLIEGMNGSLAKHSSGCEQSDNICMLSLSYLKGRELLVSE
ncbi:MAG: PP2C family protein-serine/threonine phosphatase, partial [Bacilli bacterium]